MSVPMTPRIVKWTWKAVAMDQAKGLELTAVTWLPYGLPLICPKDKLWAHGCSRRHQRTESSHWNMPKVQSHCGTAKRLPCQLSPSRREPQNALGKLWLAHPSGNNTTYVCVSNKNKQVWQLATLDGSIVLYLWKYTDHTSQPAIQLSPEPSNFLISQICTSTYELWVDDRLHVTLIAIPGLVHTARNTHQEAKPLVTCYQTGIVALPTSTCGANHLHQVVAFFGSRV